MSSIYETQFEYKKEWAKYPKFTNSFSFYQSGLVLSFHDIGFRRKRYLPEGMLPHEASRIAYRDFREKQKFPLGFSGIKV